MSAQKALVGKINGDMALLEKSRLGALEAALFHELIPARSDIIRAPAGTTDLDALVAAPAGAWWPRACASIVEQLQELHSLRGKNQSVIAHMMRRVEVEKKEFDASLFKLQGTRAVFTRLSTELYTTLGMDVRAGRTSTPCARRCSAARFATGMRAPVRNYFDAAARQPGPTPTPRSAEISAMMDVMYRKFAAEHGLSAGLLPMPFSLARYRDEIDAIEDVYSQAVRHRHLAA